MEHCASEGSSLINSSKKSHTELEESSHLPPLSTEHEINLSEAIYKARSDKVENLHPCTKRIKIEKVNYSSPEPVKNINEHISCFGQLDDQVSKLLQKNILIN